MPPGARGTFVQRRWESAGVDEGYEPFVPHPLVGSRLRLGPAERRALAEAEASLAALAAVRPGRLAWLVARAEASTSPEILGLGGWYRRVAREAFAPRGASDPFAGARGRIRLFERALAIATRDATPDRDGLCEMGRLLTGARRGGGGCRSQQNWIGPHSDRPLEADFVPPPPELVPALLDELCRYLADDSDGPVLRAALAHAQLLTIHPFPDGNGRTARTLAQAVLRRGFPGSTALVPISLAIVYDSDDYQTALQAFRFEGDLRYLVFFADLLRRGADAAIHFAQGAERLERLWAERAAGLSPRSPACRLASLLWRHPVLDSAAAARLAGVGPDAARRALGQLAERKVVRAVRYGPRRKRVWTAAGLIELLDETDRVVAPPVPLSDTS
jgi:Fic/DOC family protein